MTTAVEESAREAAREQSSARGRVAVQVLAGRQRTGMPGDSVEWLGLAGGTQ